MASNKAASRFAEAWGQYEPVGGGVDHQFETAQMATIDHAGPRQMRARIVLDEGLARRAVPPLRNGLHLGAQVYLRPSVRPYDSVRFAHNHTDAPPP